MIADYIIRRESIEEVTQTRQQMLVFRTSDGFLVTHNVNSDEECEIILTKYANKNMQYIKNEPVRGAYSAPCKIYFDITSKCNLNCIHCLNRGTNGESYSVNMHTVNAIAQYCREKGVFYIKLGGGEPLLHENVIDIIKIFRDCGMLVSMTTNGMVHDRKIIEAIHDNSVKISVSLDGPEMIHNQIRGANVYKNATTYIDMLIAAGIKPVIKYVINDCNKDINCIRHIVSFGAERGLLVNVKLMKPINDSEKSFKTINAQIVQEIMMALQNEKNVLLDETWLSHIVPLDINRQFSGRTCNAGCKSLHVGYMAKVRPCIFIDKQYFDSIPDLITSDLDTIWRKDHNFCMLRELPVAQECKSCDRECKNVCYAYRNYYSSDILGNNPLCNRKWNI